MQMKQFRVDVNYAGIIIKEKNQIITVIGIYINPGREGIEANENVTRLLEEDLTGLQEIYGSDCKIIVAGDFNKSAGEIL